MKVFYDSDCLLHNPPHEILSGRLVPCFESPARPAEQDWPHELSHYIHMVHTEDYVKHIQTIYDDWVAGGGDKSAVFPETFLHHQFAIHIQYNAAIASVRVALSAARALANSRAAHQACSAQKKLNVFDWGVVRRPPGHHAQDAVCGGYCFFNNAAIAAKYLLEHRGSKASAILDVDCHHGNGTQQIFYDDPRVLYVSLHAGGDYPCEHLLYSTGAANERGAGAGMEVTYNFPISRVDCTDAVYCGVLERAVEVIKKHDIDYLLVSLGVDTYQEDPIGDFLLTERCYPRIGEIIAGYHLETLGSNVAGVLLGFQQGVL
ncbi:hypothetical protein C8Q77DRAFT_1214524 [Trametes polyzona]|nr:hypothetical protein C8Q77DRAFT_1214524 [Trametes polyzona]